MTLVSVNARIVAENKGNGELGEDGDSKPIGTKYFRVLPT